MMRRAVNLLVPPAVMFATGFLRFFGSLVAVAFGLVIMAASLVWAGNILWAAMCAIAWGAGLPGAAGSFAWALMAAVGSFGVVVLVWWPAMAILMLMLKLEPMPRLESGEASADRILRRRFNGT
jgi:hypothetical protein